MYIFCLCFTCFHSSTDDGDGSDDGWGSEDFVSDSVIYWSFCLEDALCCMAPIPWQMEYLPMTGWWSVLISPKWSEMKMVERKGSGGNQEPIFNVHDNGNNVTTWMPAVLNTYNHVGDTRNQASNVVWCLTERPPPNPCCILNRNYLRAKFPVSA